MSTLSVGHTPGVKAWPGPMHMLWAGSVKGGATDSSPEGLFKRTPSKEVGEREFQLLEIFINIWYFLSFHHSDRCVLYLILALIVFCWWLMKLDTLKNIYWPLNILFYLLGQLLFVVFFEFVLTCRSFEYILGKNTFYDKSIANHFLALWIASTVLVVSSEERS